MKRQPLKLGADFHPIVRSMLNSCGGCAGRGGGGSCSRVAGIAVVMVTGSGIAMVTVRGGGTVFPSREGGRGASPRRRG